MEQKKVCEYCAHARCAECKPDRWPNLADGCCACRRRVLSRLRALGATTAQTVKEMPQLYGPGRAVDETCRFPFWGIP
jgi:hypothetical protein